VQEMNDGKARLLARGSDAPSLRGQTVRATIINADVLQKRPDAAARFMAAYRETIDWMYSDPQAIEIYARKIDKPVTLIRDMVRTFYSKEALQTDKMNDMPGIVRDAVKLKYIRVPLSDAQLAELVHTPPR
jgi:NitT/TauT family transport system substrate-binding protein